MTEEEEKTLKEVVLGLPDQFLECRLGNHRWIRQGAPSRESAGGGLWVLRFRCPGCKTKRFDRVTTSGTLYARWYERPKGYDIKGFGHQTRRKDTYRAVLIDRVIENENDEDGEDQ